MNYLRMALFFSENMLRHMTYRHCYTGFLKVVFSLFLNKASSKTHQKI